MRIARALLAFLALIALSTPSLGAPNKQIQSAQFSPDGKMVALYQWGGPTTYEVYSFRIDIVNAVNGKLIFEYSTLNHHAELGAYGLFIAFTPDSKSLLKLTSYYGDEYGREQFLLYKVEICGRQGAECPRKPVWSQGREACGFSASTSSPFYLAIPCGEDGLAQGPLLVRSLKQPSLEAKMRWDETPFAWGPDGDSLTLVNAEGDIEMRNIPTGELARTLSTQKKTISELAFSKNGRSTFFLASDGSNKKSKLHAIDSKTGEMRAVSFDYVAAFSMATSAVSTCKYGQKKLDVRRFSLKLRRSVNLPYECGWHALSPDASLVLTYNPKDGRLEARDTKRGKLLWSRQSWEE